MRIPALLAVLVAALPAAAVAESFDGPVFREEIEVVDRAVGAWPVADGQRVAVSFRGGELTLAAHDAAEVTASLRVECPELDEERCARYRERARLAVRSEGEAVRVGLVGVPIWRMRRLRLHGTIGYPAEAPLELSMGAGAVTIEAGTADVDARLRVGELVVRAPLAAVGSVAMSTTIGDVSIEDGVSVEGSTPAARRQLSHLGGRSRSSEPRRQDVDRRGNGPIRRRWRRTDGGLTTFDAIVDACQRRIFSYAIYFLGKAEEAEDVTQEAFMRLWKHWDAVEHDRALPWLLRVTRNLCYDRLRHGRVVRAALGEGDAEAVERVGEERPGPRELAEAGELSGLLASALSELNEPMRSIVVLREVQGFKYREIAEILDVPMSTVRIHLHRGRRRLRRRLEGLGAARTAEV